MIAEYCIAFITLIAIATLRSPSHSHSHSLTLCVLLCFDSCPCFLDLPFCLAIRTLFAPRLDIALVPGLLLLSSPLDIVRRSPTTPVYLSTLLSCSLYTCLLFVRPCLWLTMPVNKSLHLDPHVSRLVCPVTEYSAKQGFSNFSEEHWPGMDTARILLTLKQGSRSLENYIRKFLAIANYSDLPDCLLIEFFVMALINHCNLSLDARVHVHHSLSLWIMLCWLLALCSLWVSQRKNAALHLWLR